jgi:ectonucleoside triphosphate diphosphohydrolase 5/6
LHCVILFNDDTFQGAEKIAELLERAKEVIPLSELKNTPLAMKATAGLRLLPVEKAEGLLEEVSYAVEQCSIQMT